MSDALTIIVAGPGKITDDEVADLLEDAYKDVELVDVYYPMSAKGFTPGVKGVLEWANNPENGGSNVGITVTGTTASRAGKKYFSSDDPDASKPSDWEFESFTEVFDLDFGDNVVVFLAAVPQEGEEPDDEDIDELISLVEAAQAQEIDVRDLCKGLDDVNLDDAPEPEPVVDPIPEPAKPRGRRSKAPEPAEEKSVDGLQEQISIAAQQWAQQQQGTYQEGSVALICQKIGDLFYELARNSEAVGPRPVHAPSEAVAVPEESAPAAEAEQPTEAPTAPARRGRGRPRTNPNLQKQVYDADEDKWIERPRGRVAKGTKIRTVDLDTDKVVDEGTV